MKRDIFGRKERTVEKEMLGIAFNWDIVASTLWRTVERKMTRMNREIVVVVQPKPENYST